MENKSTIGQINKLLDDNFEYVQKLNRRFLLMASGLATIVLCILILVAALLKWTPYIPLYAEFATAVFIIYICGKFFATKKHHFDVRILTYLLLLGMYIMSIFISFVIATNATMVLFIITLMVTPVIMLDKPLRILCFMLFVTAAYIAIGSYVISGEAFQRLLANSLIVFAVSSAVGIYFMRVRIGHIDSLRVMKHQEDIMKISEERYAEAITTAKLAVWDYDIENRVFSLPDGPAYDAAIDYYDLDSRRIENAPESFVYHCVSDEDKEKLRRLYDSLKDGKAQVSDTIWFKNKADSEPHCDFITLNVIFDKEGKPVKARGIAQDITLRMRQAEVEELQKEIKRTQDILGSISTGICVLHMQDPDHVSLSYANEGMYKLLHYDENDMDALIPGTDKTKRQLVKGYVDSVFTGVHPDDMETAKEGARICYSKDHHIIENIRILDFNGDYIRADIDLIYRATEEGARVFYGAYRDVTEEVKMKKILTDQLERETSLRKEANIANNMKTEFLSNVSHDMRTPLNAMLGYTDLALDCSSPEEVHGYLRKISKAGGTLLSLISDTLDLQRIENGRTVIRKDSISGEEIIHDVEASVQPIMDNKGIEFNIIYDKDKLVNIVTDGTRLQEIIINLMSNSAKFTPAGGSVDFITRVTDIDDERVNYEFVVRDTGVGISEKFLPKIFEPFSQERSVDNADIGGSGLGLSIVDRLVKLLGGTIKVKSELGKGTEFTIDFNFNRADKVYEVANEEIVDNVDLNGRRILLCEDNAMNMEIAVAILENEGMTVDVATNGKTGYDMFADSEEGYYDAILMDLRMPIMNGFEAAINIRNCSHPQAKTIPVIAMSADAYESDIEKCMDAGMNGHVSKPVDRNMLFSKLRENIK